MSYAQHSCGSIMNDGNVQVPLSAPLAALKEEHIPLRMQMEAFHREAEGIADAQTAIDWEVRLNRLKEQVFSFATALDRHSSKEENLLFPMVARYIGRDVGPIAVMEYEHEQAKLNLQAFREGVAAGERPVDRETAAGLAASCVRAYTILSEHFLKEENVLFPMAERLLSQEEMAKLEDGMKGMDTDRMGTNSTKEETDMDIRFSGEQKIGDIVTAFPKAADIFKGYGIDFCCGGGHRLADAASKQSLPLDRILASLEESYAKNAGRQSDRDWAAASYGELIGHVIDVHHMYLREELPILNDYVNKIARVHGGNHPELVQVQGLFHTMKAELEEHLAKEEELLFPLIREYELTGSAEFLEKGGARLNELESEHAAVGDILRQIRELTADYALPDDACRTYTLTFRKLQDIENDLFTHIHLENNILFPRFLSEQQN